MSEMKPCITTMPIMPIHKPGIGLLVAPFVMDVLGKKLGVSRVLALNINGAKLFGEDVERHFHGYVDSVTEMGIIPDFVWRDDQGENIHWISEFFQKLRGDGSISREVGEIIRCECGAVESLARAENISLVRRLYYTDAGRRFCNLCNTELMRSSQVVYLFHFPDISLSIQVFPQGYHTELVNIVKKFAGLKLLISRTRRSAFPVWTGDEHIFLDVDFVWQMFLPLLRRYGYNPQFIVGGRKNLLVSCLAFALLRLLDEQESFLIVPPYYVAPARKRLKGEEYLLEPLVKKYGAKTLRLFLATGMHWTTREIVLDFRLLELVHAISERVNSQPSEPATFNEVIGSFEGTKLKKLFAGVRIRKKTFYRKELFGVI